MEVKEGTLDVSDLPLGWITGGEETETVLLGATRITSQLVQESRLEYVFSRYDNILVLSVYTGAPLYTHYTYFGLPDFRDGVEINKDIPESFVGGIITGVCLHGVEFDSHIIRAFDNM